MSELVQMITSEVDAIRNRSLSSVCEQASFEELLEHCRALDLFRRTSSNLYHRVRALFFLAAIHRYQLPHRLPAQRDGLIPFEAYRHLLERRFAEAIEALLQCQDRNLPSVGLSSALAQAYRDLGFQTLADQVRRSVRTVRGNQWMFRVGHPADHPLRLRRELSEQVTDGAPFPVLRELTAVRMDFSHSAWSDIFFLGMDFPAGARVLNASIDLGVRGRDPQPRPPIETYLRVIDRPLLRLVSVDLNAVAEIHSIAEVFDFARDYLGLLKAAVIASGLVPPGVEGCQQTMSDLLEELVGPGLGLELVSKVNDIPKGSRLAVSTNLLGSLIAICMRATGQVTTLTGTLQEADRRIVAARAILGEWLAGSGGGWQDSGGMWPGVKLISGCTSREGDPEYGVSRGRLLPAHRVLTQQDCSSETREKLQNSLVLVHGGMAQNVGPILEMVTEKYLLRGDTEWQARRQAIAVLDEVLEALRHGDVKAVGRATTRNFYGPLQAIIPWCTNLFTDTLVQKAQEHFGERFWGFWMLGGMSGGGMGFLFDGEVKLAAQEWLQTTMRTMKQQLEHTLPFAMEPVVYDFAINDRGTWADLRCDRQATMPEGYYGLLVPDWLRSDIRELSPQTRRELEQVGTTCRTEDGATTTARLLLDRILPQVHRSSGDAQDLATLLDTFGFDREHHEQIRHDLRSGLIGLAQNRLPPSTTIEDVALEDVNDLRQEHDQALVGLGEQAVAQGQVGVLTLAAGVGSRWTEGAGVVKALHPFCQMAGRHRCFLEVHLGKTRKTRQQYDAQIPHLFATGYLTHDPISRHLKARDRYGFGDSVILSPGRAVGLRTIPMVRDLHFAWEEMPQQILDEQQQKVRSSLRAALINWAQQMGEGQDYTDNLPVQCLHPVGHWYELPNMLRNGVLSQLLQRQPELKYLMLHNVDTLGASIDAGVLGMHIDRGFDLSFEVVARRLDDRGGGLARIDGHPRLLEGLVMPREEDEFRLSYYNSMTTWISLDSLLRVFGLEREALSDTVAVDRAVQRMARRMPTYVTIKDVKKRWGHGQEDIYPVTQFEKLWSDMSALREIRSGYFVVPLVRGQQLKQQSQLDAWLRDGSAAQVASLCEWDDTG